MYLRFSKIRFVWLLVIIAIVGVFVFLYGFDHCIKEDREKRRSFSGIVTSKYRDSTNSNFFTIEIDATYKYHIVGFGSYLADQKVYSDILVGDSVFKIGGAKVFHVHSINDHKEYVIDYGCDEHWWRWNQRNNDKD